jgi:hypothetical protein
MLRTAAADEPESVEETEAEPVTGELDEAEGDSPEEPADSED